MGQLVNLFIVLASLGGILFVLWRKIPLLLELPAGRESDTSGISPARTRSIVSSAKLKSVAVKNLDKTLSKARMFASKTEAATGEWLERLNKKSEERKEQFSESYWEQLRKGPKR